MLTDADSCAALYDRHARALFSLALLVSGRRSVAESAVAQAIVAACLQRASTIPGTHVLNELSRLTFLACGSATQHDRGQIVAAEGCLASLNPNQRAMIGLTMYGDHTYHQAAALLGLPPAIAAELLRVSLHDAAAALRDLGA